jgi:5'(3')-deoxyribonucleotidase
MDGVIADFHGTLLDIYNRDHKEDIKKEHITTFQVEQCLGEDVWIKMEKIYNSPGFFASIKPVESSKGVVQELHTLVDIEICSAPTKIVNAKTGERQLNAHCAFEKINWIHEHFPSLSKDITLAINKHHYRADILVDDALHNQAQWCKAHPNGLGILINQPWNQTNRLPRNCIRTSINEVPALIKEHFPVTT